jgi:Tfp pilus assembly protein PilV
MKRKLRFSILMLLMAVCGAANVQAENVTFTFNTDEGLKALNIAKPKTSNGTNLDTEKPYTMGIVSMLAKKQLPPAYGTAKAN